MRRRRYEVQPWENGQAVDRTESRHFWTDRAAIRWARRTWAAGVLWRAGSGDDLAVW